MSNHIQPDEVAYALADRFPRQDRVRPTRPAGGVPCGPRHPRQGVLPECHSRPRAKRI